MGRFKNIEKKLDLVSFSSKKLIDMGFKFKYSLEDMYVGAIDTCQEKGLLPRATTHNYTNGHDNGHANGNEKI